MKKSNRNLIWNFLFGNLILLTLTTSTLHAAPVVRSNASTEPLAIGVTVAQFLEDIGGANNGAGNSYTNGFREVNWDLIPNNQIGLNGTFAANYFNTVSPRGMVLASACADDSVRVSSTGQNGEPLRFGDINPAYTNSFQRFTGQRLYAVSPGKCNYTDIYFYVPGTNKPATVTSFGAVFTDIDEGFSTNFRAYGVDGKQIGSGIIPQPLNNGLSFVGVTYKDGERIARIRIYAGTASLGNTDTAGSDVVAMDDFYFSEPRATGQHAGDFDGDGTADLTIFRPANGSWHVLQSGSNTYASLQFGQSGDVSVDGDFDGDSRNDYAVFRPSNGVWYILQSSNNQARYQQFGLAGDKPVVADYDKDGKTDIALWRSGNYHILQSSNNQYKAVQWGLAGDVPIGAAQ